MSRGVRISETTKLTTYVLINLKLILLKFFVTTKTVMKKRVTVVLYRGAFIQTFKMELFANIAF